METYDREPCPWRILDDAGGAFAMGAVGGSLWHGAVGFKNAPRTGMYTRAAAAFGNLRLRAPVVGTQFAAWGGMFSVFDCSLAHIRGKEDPLNSIASGAITGAALTVRNGPAVMIMSGLFGERAGVGTRYEGGGGVLLAMIEGVGLVMNNYMAKMYDPSQMPEEPPPPDDAKPGWFSGWFGPGEPGSESQDPLGNPTTKPPATVYDATQATDSQTTPFGMAHKI